MQRRRKFIRYIFFGLAAVFGTLLLAAGGVYLYQDKIIQLFVAEGNKHIKTKVAVEKIDVSLWEKFPRVAIRLHNVEVTEAVENSTKPLAKLAQVHSTFSLWDMVRGTYRIKDIYLQDGELLVKVLPNGEVNYLFYQDADTTHSGNLRFDLERIILQNVHVTYQDAPGKQRYVVQAKALTAALNVDNALVAIKIQGKALVESITVGDTEFLKQQELTIRSQVAINTQEKNIILAPSDFHLGRAEYQVAGSIAYGSATVLDLNVEGKNTTVQSLLAFVPAKFTKQLGQYQSAGNVYFKGQVKGEVSSGQNPFLDVAFGCKNASFYHPEYKEKIENVTMQGRFTNGAKRNQQTSLLELKNVRGSLRGRPFSGMLVYRNFVNPTLEVRLNADVDVAHVLGVFPVKQVKNGSGLAKIAFSFAGNVATFKANPASATIKTSGEVQLRNVQLLFPQHPLPLAGLTGTFLFRKNDVAITDFKGRIGDSDFRLNGFFKNMLPWLFLKNQKLRIEADFTSASVNLDQLLASASAQPMAKNSVPNKGKTQPAYVFNLPANLELDFNASVGQLRFRRFTANRLQGQVRLQNQVLTTRNIALQAAGGRFKVQGRLDARQPLIKVSSTAHLNRLAVDSLMYVFENFGQEFITQRHLSGQLTAQVESDLFFDHHLNPRTDLMQAEVKTTLQNGQLLAFAPLQKMSAFVDRAELANLRFSEIKNNFWIQNRTIYIPEMEIKSSTSRFSTITVSGTHTFDQVMDYRLRIPLANRTPRPDKDAQFGTIAASSTPNPHLFLTIKGKEGNFKVAYDQAQVKTKIATDIKREKQELKEVLQGKKKEEKAIKPAEEYFDFD